MDRELREAVARLQGRIDRLAYKLRVGLDERGNLVTGLDPSDLLRLLSGVLVASADVAAKLAEHEGQVTR